jgi:RNA polymerase sigma factor (sigma-70 family)
LDSRELIRLCLEGNRNAQKRLFEDYATTMTRICQRYMGDDDAAQDVLMEGFLKVFDYLKDFQYQGEYSLAMWIRKIMINQCLMKLRGKHKQFYLHIDDQHFIDPGEVAADSVSAEEIITMINSLPVGYRTVFNLYAIDGYSHKEIAVLLEITESASRSQLTHARAKLKELLHKHGW